MISKFPRFLTFGILAVGMTLSCCRLLAVDDSYSNEGIISGTPPNVDATNFYNKGTWNIALIGTAPYKTAHTYNYTNIGSMTSVPGWEFDYGPSVSGTRSWTANFLNDNPGIIAGNPYLWISATNIINRGLLQIGTSGELKLTGSQVTLARSRLQVTPIVGGISAQVPNTPAFLPDAAIYDQYWNQDNMTFNSGILWDGANATTPNFNVFMPCVTKGSTLIDLLGLTESNTPTPFSAVDSLTQNAALLPVSITNLLSVTTNLIAVTNIVTISNGVPTIVSTTKIVTVTNYPADTTIFLPTNIVRQAVFVQVGNAGIRQPIIRFTPSTIATNPFSTVSIGFLMPYTNTTALGLVEKGTNAIYLRDDLSSSTNRGLWVNNLTNAYALCASPTYRPINFLVQRTPPQEFFDGSSGDGVPTNNFFSRPTSARFNSFTTTTTTYSVTNFISQTETNSVTNFVTLVATNANSSTGGFTNLTANSAYAGYSCLVDNLGSPTLANTAATNLPGRVRINANNLDLTKATIRGEGDIYIQATNLINSAGAVIDCENLSFDLGANSGLLNFTNLAGNPEVVRLKGTVSAWSATWNNQADIVIRYRSFTNDSGNITEISPVVMTNTVYYSYSVLIVDASQLQSQIPVTVQSLTLHSTNIVISDSMTISDKLLLDGQSVNILGDIALTGSLSDWVTAFAPQLLYFTNSGNLRIPNNAHFGDDTASGYAAFVNRGTISSASQSIKSDYLEVTGGSDSTSAGSFSATSHNGILLGATVFSPTVVNFYSSNLIIAASSVTSGGSLNFTVTNTFADGGASGGSTFTAGNGFNLLTKPVSGDLLGSTFTTYADNGAEVMHTWAGLDQGTNFSGFTNNAAMGELVLSRHDSLESLFHFVGAAPGSALYVGYLNLANITSDDELNEMLQIDPNITIYYANAALGYTPPSGTAAQYLDGQFGGHLRWVKGYASQAVNLSGTYSSGGTGGFTLTIQGLPGQPYIIQSSTNLVDWTSVYTNTGPVFTFTNTTAYPYNFYRTLIP